MNSEREKDERRNLKEKIDNIDHEIDEEDRRIRKISAVQDSLTSLKKNIDKCATLLSKSLDDGAVKENFENLVTDNNVEFRKSCQGFEEQAETLRRRVIDLRNEREATLQEYEKRTHDDDEDE